MPLLYFQKWLGWQLISFLRLAWYIIIHYASNGYFLCSDDWFILTLTNRWTNKTNDETSFKINEEKYPDVFSEAIVVNKHIEVLQTLLTRDIGCRPFFGVRKLWELHNFFRYINSKKKRETNMCIPWVYSRQKTTWILSHIAYLPWITLTCL